MFGLDDSVEVFIRPIGTHFEMQYRDDLEILFANTIDIDMPEWNGIVPDRVTFFKKLFPYEWASAFAKWQKDNGWEQGRYAPSY